MVDAKTAALVGAAILSPYAFDMLRSAGVPIPVYVSPGQIAALAAFPASISGVSMAPKSGAIADSQTFFARWNLWNAALKSQNGVATNVTNYANTAWNATNFAKVTTAQAMEFGGALIAAATAGGNVKDGYPASLNDSDEFQALTGMLATGAMNNILNGTDDPTSYVAPIFALVIKMDSIGVLASGKPFVPTVSDGVAFALGKTVDFVTGIAGDVAGGVARAGLGVLLSTPGLMLIASVIIYKVVRK